MDQILHNLPIDNNPSDTKKIAMGDGTSTDTNITLANFYTLLMSKLGFFKVSNFFSEIFGNASAMASARTNLDVPSNSQMSTADNLRALKSNVIEKDSTSTYTPTLSTHPVNLGMLNKGGTDTGWQSCTKVSSKVETASFDVKARKIGAFIFVTGKFLLTNDPDENDVLFNLPAGMSTASAFYFTAGDGNSDSIIELCAIGGSIAVGPGVSVDSVHIIGTSFPWV